MAAATGSPSAYPTGLPSMTGPFRLGAAPARWTGRVSPSAPYLPLTSADMAIQRQENRFRGPSGPRCRPLSGSQPEAVLISHSAEDVKFLRMLMRHLEVLENQRMIRIFAYEALPPGTLWQEVVRVEISNAVAAILLVSPDYLSSRALAENQLPQLLAQAEAEDGTAILPLLVKPSLFYSLPHLYRFKPFNPTPKTLIEMRAGEKERFLVSVAEAVQEEVRRRRTGRAGDVRL